MTTGYLPYFFEVEQDHLRERLHKEAREAVQVINPRRFFAVLFVTARIER